MEISGKVCGTARFHSTAAVSRKPWKMGLAWVCRRPAQLSYSRHAWVGGWVSRLRPFVRKAIYMSSSVHWQEFLSEFCTLSQSSLTRWRDLAAELLVIELRGTAWAKLHDLQKLNDQMDKKGSYINLVWINIPVFGTSHEDASKQLLVTAAAAWIAESSSFLEAPKPPVFEPPLSPSFFSLPGVKSIFCTLFSHIISLHFLFNLAHKSSLWSPLGFLSGSSNLTIFFFRYIHHTSQFYSCFKTSNRSCSSDRSESWHS